MRRGLVLIALALACFALSPLARAAVVGPPQDANTADGFDALRSNTTGDNNTAVGAFAMQFNTEGFFNTAIGGFALNSNTTGLANTAVGVHALINNINGNENVAVGLNALRDNTTGDDNTAVGRAALRSNIDGIENVAFGAAALFSATGDHNTAIGDGAGDQITSGSGNVCVGGETGTGITVGNNIIAIGESVSGVSSAFGEVDNSCYIGNIFGQPADPATITTVGIDADGKLGTVVSSRRFKKEIKPMDQISEAVLALKPVTFHYKIDKKGTPQFGLVAEEVAEISPDLVVRDKNGEILTVRYEAVNAMLLNEFLKEHRKVDKLEASGAQQEKKIQALTASLKEQAAQIQKVSGQLEASKPAPQVVNNP
jgi:trimeric autotransporter adhesin